MPFTEKPPLASQSIFPTTREALREFQGSIAAFELVVPGAQRLTAPAHSHDHYEETTYGIDGVLTWTVGKSMAGRGRHYAFPEALYTASITTAART